MSAVRFCVYCISAMSRPCLRSTFVDAARELLNVLLEDDAPRGSRIGVVARHPLAPERRARLADREVAQQAEALDGLAHRPRDVGELLPGPLHARERDEARRISLVPSKMRLMRASRSSRS